MISAATTLPLSPPDCIQDQGSLCAGVYRTTHNEWLAGSADWLIAKPLQILLIIVLALVIRFIAHRVIRRITRGTANASVPGVLRPLKERAPKALVDSTPLIIERRRQRSETVGSVLRSITSAVVFVIAFMLVLGELGIDLAPLIASAGIAGVAIGFGAQNLVRDFLSGIFMILEDQYGVGDLVDVGDVIGTVEAVGLRTTRLRDIAGAVWYVRNGEIMRVANRSQGWARIVLDVPLPYTADSDRAAVVLQEVAEEVCAREDIAPAVLETPEVVGVQDLTVEGVTVRLFVKVRPADKDLVSRALRGAVKGRFSADQVPAPTPWPARQVATS